ncbi:MAG: hypothetical protein PVF27_01085, partial [Gemmatimonadales bacterium]
DIAQRWLAEHLPLLGSTRKHAAYGPCGMSGLATEGLHKSRAGGRGRESGIENRESWGWEDDSRFPIPDSRQ